MAGEQGYPWTVMQKTRSQDEGGDESVGPWIVAWRWRPGWQILVLSKRLLANFASEGPGFGIGAEKKSAIGLFMDAQVEDPHKFTNRTSALRIRDDVKERALNHRKWSAAFECRVLTKTELDRWNIEAELEKTASESGPGASA